MGIFGEVSHVSFGGKFQEDSGKRIQLKSGRLPSSRLVSLLRCRTSTTFLGCSWSLNDPIRLICRWKMFPVIQWLFFKIWGNVDPNLCWKHVDLIWFSILHQFDGYIVSSWFFSHPIFLLARLSAQLVCRIEQLFEGGDNGDAWDINASFSDFGWDKDDHCIISKILENTTLLKHCTLPTHPSKSCKCNNGKWKMCPNISMF